MPETARQLSQTEYLDFLLTVKGEVLLVDGQVGVQALQLRLVHLAGVGDRQRHLELPASGDNFVSMQLSLESRRDLKRDET